MRCCPMADSQLNWIILSYHPRQKKTQDHLVPTFDGAYNPRTSQKGEKGQCKGGGEGEEAAAFYYSRGRLHEVSFSPS